VTREERSEGKHTMSEPAVIDGAGVAHLRRLIAHMRPDWHQPGIRAALEQAMAGHPYAVVAVAAVTAAADPKASTPAVIRARCGWTAPPAPPAPPLTRLPPRVSELRCPRCGLVNTEGEAHECQRRADPDAAARYAELARQAARASGVELRAREERRRTHTTKRTHPESSENTHL
jgi:hypothetical protein